MNNSTTIDNTIQMEFIAENIPAELQRRHQWLNWRWELRNGRWTKPPLGRVNDHTTWCSFATALRRHQGEGLGVGFVLTRDDDFVGIDFDDCRDPQTKTIAPWVMAWLQRLGSYAEVSPSGRGVKVIARGRLSRDGIAGRAGQYRVEVYRAGRYFALTGQVLDGLTTIREAQDEIEELVALLEDTRRNETAAPAPERSLTLADVRDALSYLSPWQGDYHWWLSILMAIHSAFPGEDGLAVAEAWADGYPGEVASKWRSFDSGGGITIATLIAAAQDNGWVPPWRRGREATRTAEKSPPSALAPIAPIAPIAPNGWPPGEAVLAALARGETGDAELIAAMYTDRIAYDHSENTWYIFDGEQGVWSADRLGRVQNLPGTTLAAAYLRTAADLAAAAQSEREHGTVKELQRRAAALYQRQRRTNVLVLAATQPALALSGEEWHAHPWALPTPNGIIDLRDGSCRPATARDYVRAVTPTPWRGLEAPAPRWSQFLREVFADDAELIAFVQRLFGAALVAKPIEHVLGILWGRGRNGKDTLLHAIRATLGPHLADNVPAEVLIADDRRGGGPAPHLWRLRGLRIAWVNESDEGARLRSAQVKHLTGGGVITARPLYGNPLSWEPTHTLFLVTNRKPHAPADDYALWQRVLLIPFTVSFVDDPRGERERRRDPLLSSRLEEERSGILSWLVRGCLEWQKEGLRPAEKVRAATEEYRREEDILAQWMGDCCVLSEHAQAGANELYESYCQWCEAMRLPPMRGTDFGRRLGELFAREHTRRGNIYRGIGLRAEV